MDTVRQAQYDSLNTRLIMTIRKSRLPWEFVHTFTRELPIVGWIPARLRLGNEKTHKDLHVRLTTAIIYCKPIRTRATDHTSSSDPKSKSERGLPNLAGFSSSKGTVCLASFSNCFSSRAMRQSRVRNADTLPTLPARPVRPEMKTHKEKQEWGEVRAMNNERDHYMMVLTRRENEACVTLNRRSYV